MNGTARKLFVTILLTLCVGVHVLELSGQWDRTFMDANDEASIVAVILCVGVALSVTGTVLKRIGARSLCHFIAAPCLTAVRIGDFAVSLSIRTSGPPLVPLRI